MIFWTRHLDLFITAREKEKVLLEKESLRTQVHQMHRRFKRGFAQREKITETDRVVQLLRTVARVCGYHVGSLIVQ